MTIRIPIRHLVALRAEIPDRTLVDYLELAVLTPEPGVVSTSGLRERWRCSQSMVSRRLAAINAAGLAEITSGYGLYHVHWLEQLGVSA